MIYRGRERRSRRRVVLKAYLRSQRNPVRAAALERERELLVAAGPHPGIITLERVLEVRGGRVWGWAQQGPGWACTPPWWVHASRLQAYMRWNSLQQLLTACAPCKTLSVSNYCHLLAEHGCNLPGVGGWHRGHAHRGRRQQRRPAV